MHFLRSIFFVVGILSVQAWKCSDIKVQDFIFDLSPLDAEVQLEMTLQTPPTTRYDTYTLNPCSPLEISKSVPSSDQCPEGTFACKTVSVAREKDKPMIIEVDVYAARTDNSNEPEVVLLRGSGADERLGLQVDYQGGVDSQGSRRSTRLNFVCDKGADRGKPSLNTTGESNMAVFEWRTSLVCAKPSDDNEHGRKPHDRPEGVPPRSGSWGFFTWLFVIVFMAIASFLIFTLFLNYNRYGQVGLDLVPAMDSVKDIPYLFKDFASQVVETVKGGGLRSGYSAV